jgi:hypothetical protein
VKAVQPLVDAYCEGLWKELKRRGVSIFYDHFSMERRLYDTVELKNILKEQVTHSHLFTAFRSPCYFASRWCNFEWRVARYKFDQEIIDKLSASNHYNTDASELDHKPFLIHQINWKGRLKRNERISPYPITDVSYAHYDPSFILEAAGKCVIDTMRLLKQQYPQLFDRWSG